MDHVTLNFNIYLSTAAILLDFENAFDTTWHPGLLYKFIKLNFSVNTVRLISSFLTGNLESRSKARCLDQEKYKLGYP